MGALVLRSRLRSEVHPLEHEGPQREHRLPHLRRLPYVVDTFGRLNDVADERVDPRRSRRPEDCDLVVREIVVVEEAIPDRVVDVVVDVGHTVDYANDLSFYRLGLALAGVREDPVANLVA